MVVIIVEKHKAEGGDGKFVREDSDFSFSVFLFFWAAPEAYGQGLNFVLMDTSQICFLWAKTAIFKRISGEGLWKWLPKKKRGSGMDWECGVNRCKLLPLGWISNEILLGSTGNYASHLWRSRITGEKECTYACVAGSPCCTVGNWQNTVNQL